MIPDELNEKPSRPSTPIFVLGIAAVLLLVVGFISYRDYVNTMAERQLAQSDERIRQLEEKISELSRSREPSAKSPATAAQAKDEELEKIRREMLELKQQTEENRRKTEEVLNQRQNTAAATDSILPPIPSEILNPTLPPEIAKKIDDQVELPPYLRDAVRTPPAGGSPSSFEAEQRQVAAQVRNAAAIGKVTYFNSEHNLVVFDAGRKNNVKQEQRYSIRRGSDMVAAVRVIETTDSESTALVVTNLKNAGEMIKPEVGDDVILLDGF